MPHLPEETLHCDTLSVGATRPAMLKGIPFGFVPVIFFSAAGCVFLTRDPLWLLLMVPMALGGARADRAGPQHAARAAALAAQRQCPRRPRGLGR